MAIGKPATDAREAGTSGLVTAEHPDDLREDWQQVLSTLAVLIDDGRYLYDKFANGSGGGHP